MIQLFSEAQIEDYLGVGEGTLQRMRRQGEGPAYLSITKTNRQFLQKDVEAFVLSRRREPMDGGARPSVG